MHGPIHCDVITFNARYQYVKIIVLIVKSTIHFILYVLHRAVVGTPDMTLES